jgi:hypothetical protein
LLAHLLAIC